MQIAQTTTDKIVIKTADTRALKMECCTRREERVDHANYARLPDFANTCVVIGDVCDDCGLGAFEAIFSGAPLDLDKEGEARTECLDILGIVCPVIYDFDDATYNAHLEFVLKYKVSYLLDWLLRFKPKGIAKMSNTEIVNHISCRDDTYHYPLRRAENSYGCMKVLEKYMYPPVSQKILEQAVIDNNYGFMMWIIENKPKYIWNQRTLIQLAFSQAHLHLTRLFVHSGVDVKGIREMKSTMRAPHESSGDYMRRKVFKQMLEVF